MNRGKWGNGVDNARVPDAMNRGGVGPGGYRGTMIMKSVSIFLASARRTSTVKGDEKSGLGGLSGDKRKFVMEDASGKINPKLVESFKKKTHFTKTEIESLCRIYKKLVSNCITTSKALAAATSNSVIAKPHATIEGIDRIVFRELLHSTFDIITEDILLERIFCAWDKGQGLPVRLEGWLTGLSVFLRGTPAEKTSFCFRVYDLNMDGFITRDEMFMLLKNCLIKQPGDEDPDEGVRDLVEIALKKFDLDKDGKVSFEDFSTAVIDEPLLLEAFGQCLPSDSATLSFLSTL